MGKYSTEYNLEKWAEMYGDRDFAWEGAEPIVDVLLYLTEAKNVLDIACLRGDFLSFFEKHISSVGIDLSKWGIKNKFCNSEIIKGNCISLPFQNDEFDLITMFDIVEHLSLKDLKLTLGEVKRCTKKSIVILPAALLESENEFISDTPSNDVANHLIFWKNDKWLQVISEFLAPKFVFDADATIKFTTILNRLEAYPEQWRCLLIFKRNDRERRNR